LVGVEDVISSGFGFGVVLREADVADFEAIGDNGADHHGLFAALFGDQNCDF
jgi:hypothetical protein